jgi:hypothetical protein
MTLHDRVLSALQANKQLSPVTKAAYVARLAALQRITGADSLEQVLLQPSSRTLQAPREQKCSSTGQPLANSSRKAYVASALAALKYTPELLQNRAYRRARREFVRAFKELRSQVDQHIAQCASGEALPSRCDGYLPWDALPMGSTERVLLELHTCYAVSGAHVSTQLSSCSLLSPPRTSGGPGPITLCCTHMTPCAAT